MEIQLTPENIQFPVLSFLDKDITEEYSEAVKRFNSKRARNSLNIFEYTDEIMNGSNSFGNILASKIAGIPLASPSQLEHAVRLSPNSFKRTYTEPALILRTNGDSYSDNNHNAMNLYTQLKKRGIKPTEESPVRISLKGLELEEDNDSFYGLVHKLTNEAEILQDRRFNFNNNGEKFLKSDERGVPIYLSDDEISKLSEEKKSQLRTFYARKDGLDGLYLYWDLDLNSYLSRNLALSDADGRVAVAKNFSIGNMEGYMAKLSEERDSQINEIKEKYEKAMNIMNG